MSLLSFAWVEPIKALLEPVSGAVTVANAVLPDHLKRRLKAFVYDFHPFRTTSTNHDLMRALRIAWCEATLGLLKQANKRTRDDPAYAHERDVVERLSRGLRRTLGEVRDRALQRHIPVGDSPIDAVARLVIANVPEYVAGDFDGARGPDAPAPDSPEDDSPAKVERRIAEHLVETLPKLVADSAAFDRSNAATYNAEEQRYRDSPPKVMLDLATEGWPLAKEAAPTPFGQHLLAEFAEALKNGSYPEATKAFDIYLHEQTQAALRELGKQNAAIGLTLDQLRGAIGETRTMARQVEDMHGWLRTPYRFSPPVAQAVEQRIDELTPQLFGREADLAALDTLFERESGVTLLTGPGGVGKSALLAAWVRRRHRFQAHVAYHFFTLLEPETVAVDTAWAQLAIQAWAYHEGPLADAPPPATAYDDLFRLIQLDARPNLPLVIVIDSLDEAGGPVRPLGPVKLGKHVHLVVSARADADETPAYLEPWLKWHGPRQVLKSLGSAAFEAWIPVANPRLSAGAAELAMRVERLSDGLPLLARFLLEDIAQAADKEAALRQIPDSGEVANGLLAYVERYLVKMLAPTDPATEVERGLLALLAIAKGPIDARELTRTRIVGAVYAASLRNPVRRWLRIVGPVSGESFGFLHTRLAKAFETLLLEVPDVRERLMVHLRQWTDHKGPYALRWLPDHLMEAGVRDDGRELAGLLGSLAFMQARLATGDPLGWLALTLRNIDELDRCWPSAGTDKGVQAIRSVVARIEPRLRPQIAFGRTSLRDMALQLAATEIGLRPSEIDRRLRRVLSGHTSTVRGALVLLDGRILSWSWDGTLRRWTADGDPAGAPMEGHTGGVSGALALPDGRILSWSDDGTLRRWTVDGASVGAPIEAHAGGVTGALALPDGHILSWSWDGTLRLWAADGKPVGPPIQGHTGAVNGALAVPDGRILSWSRDGTLQLWTAAGDQIGVPMEGHVDGVSGALTLPDGRFFSWFANGRLRLWTADGAPVATPMADHRGGVSGALVLPDGRILLWYRYGTTLELWTADGTTVVGAPMVGHTDVVAGALALPDKRILSWSWDGTLRLWTADGKPVGPPMHAHTDGVTGALALPDGRILSWSEDFTLRMWTADGNPGGAPLEAHTAIVEGALALPDGRILSWSEDFTLRLWTADGDLVGVPMGGHADRVKGALSLPEVPSRTWLEYSVARSSVT